MRDVGNIFWPRCEGSRFGYVSPEEGQVVFNRAVMASALSACVFRGALYDYAQLGSTLVWFVLVAVFLAVVAWGRMHYRSVGPRMPSRLLVVEDDAPNAAYLSRAARLAGWDVDSAATLAEARSLLGRMPRAVILDAKLGGESGLDLMRDLPRGQGAPRVIVVTGTQDPGTLAAIMAVRPHAVIHKPADLATLMSALGEP